MQPGDVAYLRWLAELLRRIPRMGLAIDIPEGMRYIQLSDTLTLAIASSLEAIIAQEEQEPHP